MLINAVQDENLLIYIIFHIDLSKIIVPIHFENVTFKAKIKLNSFLIKPIQLELFCGISKGFIGLSFR